jgi:hypothetical protein
VIVAQIFAPGFNERNLKTITVDMPDVFELVNTTEQGVDTGISINVQNVVDELPEGEDTTPITYDDIYVKDGHILDNTMVLDRTDGTSVGIDLSNISGWYEGD